MLSMRKDRWIRPLRPLCVAGVLAMGLGASVTTAPVLGQDSEEAPRDPALLLKDYIHYITVAQFDLAAANAQALLNLGITPVEFVDVVESDPRLEARFDEAYRRSQRRTELESLGASLFELYDDGRKARARDPQEIRRNIDLLTQNRRAQLLARDRIAAAGEYAVPHLLGVLTAQRNPLLENEVQEVMVSKLGPNAVAPLCAALPQLPPEVGESVIRVLGRIPYRMSLPYLYEASVAGETAAVREAAVAAIRNIEGTYDNGTPLGARYRELGENYYGEPPSLTRFAGEDFQLLWEYRPDTGLYPVAIRTEVYHEARAMELAEKSLELDGSDRWALALWLASNFSRELDQPEGYENPAYGPERRDAMYYAVAAGAPSSQEVLRRAIQDRDTRLARKAIEALSRSASGVDLAEGFGSQIPLVEALYYPDRRVQYEAALALGSANPVSGFDGADRVVPLLSSAIREAGTRYAVVVADDLEEQQRIRTLLESRGYEVLPPVKTLRDAEESISEVAGVDLMIGRTTPDRLQDMIESARQSNRLAATPVLGITSFNGVNRMSSTYAGDPLTRVVREGVSLQEIGEGARQLVEEAAGSPVTEAEAEAYAIACLNVLRELSVSRNGVLEVADAAPSLISALSETTGEVRIEVADVLSRIGQQRVQIALMDAALSSVDEEQVVLLEKMISSAKRFGNLLESRHVEELMDIADYGDDREATVAAALIGALNLPRDELVSLILNQ